MSYEKPPIPERPRPTTEDVKAALGAVSIIRCNQNLEPLLDIEAVVDGTG